LLSRSTGVLPMFRRAMLAISELALWVLLLVMLFGCEAKQVNEPTDATPVANETKTSTTVAATASPDNNASQPTTAMDQKLIPRDVLFGNPQRAQARLSPDGKYLSFSAPVDGVLNVWVGPADDMSKAKPVTKEKVRPVRSYNWAFDSKHILYAQDTNG